MRVSFNAARHGFAFANEFINNVSIAGIPIAQTRGRCGGMAFAALDYWHHQLRIPSPTGLPADGNPVADYIEARLITSISDNWPMFYHFMRTPDHPTWINGIGVARATREEEFPKLQTLLDQGLPQPIGLVQSRDPGGFGDDHQVVAYGYEEAGDLTRVFIWDNNHPGEENVLEFRTVYDPGDHSIRQNDVQWRGFFVERYSPQTPWYLAEGKLMSDQSGPRVYVVYGGAKFWITSPAEFDRLGLRWSEVVELPAGSLAYVADVPGDRSFLREIDRPEVYLTYGGSGFRIPDPDTLLRLGSWADVRVLPQDSLNALEKIPSDDTLLREETKPPVYLVAGGLLHWVPDPETFAARGLRWDRVGIVPDGTLTPLPTGDPLPPVHRLTWAEQPAGHLVTRDHDQVDYHIEPGVRPTDEVEFVLVQAEPLTWRKELVLHADDAEFTIGVQDAVRQATEGLYRYQLPDGQLRFRKAKTFGIMTAVLELGELDTLLEGARVTFTWVRD